MRPTFLLVILLIAAACSKGPPVATTSGPMPRTCDRPRFQAAVDEFGRLAAQRDEALARVESTPTDEAVHYVKQLEEQKARVKGLAEKAETVEIPRCLTHARELFVRFMDESGATMELRRPGGDFTAYRLALETVDHIRAQFDAEVKLQKKNEN